MITDRQRRIVIQNELVKTKRLVRDLEKRLGEAYRTITDLDIFAAGLRASSDQIAWGISKTICDKVRAYRGRTP